MQLRVRDVDVQFEVRRRVVSRVPAPADAIESAAAGGEHDVGHPGCQGPFWVPRSARPISLSERYLISLNCVTNVATHLNEHLILYTCKRLLVVTH